MQKHSRCRTLSYRYLQLQLFIRLIVREIVFLSFDIHCKKTIDKRKNEKVSQKASQKLILRSRAIFKYLVLRYSWWCKTKLGDFCAKLVKLLFSKNCLNVSSILLLCIFVASVLFSGQILSPWPGGYSRQPYAIVDYIPPSVTKNLATGKATCVS
jgi:hypothetical protein